jgi:hypothetical protein
MCGGGIPTEMTRGSSHRTCIASPAHRTAFTRVPTPTTKTKKKRRPKKARAHALGPCIPRDATRPPPNRRAQFSSTPLAPYHEAYIYTSTPPPPHRRAPLEQSLIPQAKHTRLAGPSSRPDGSPRRLSAHHRSGRLPPLRRLRVRAGAVVCSGVFPRARAGGWGGGWPSFRDAARGVLSAALPARSVPDALDWTRLTSCACLPVPGR